MNLRNLSLLCLLALGAPAARAQVSIHVNLGLPAAPHLVLVAPGVQVVEDFDDEVFFHSGWYWCRRQDGWYRARSPRARFDWVEVRRVPPVLVRVPPGHYRNWHDGDRRHHEWREREMERREARREREQERREERRERRESRKHRHHDDDDD